MRDKPCIGLSARPDGLTLAQPQFTKKQLKFKVFETAPLNYSDPTERGGLAPMVKQLLPNAPARGVKNDVAVCCRRQCSVSTAFLLNT